MDNDKLFIQQKIQELLKAHDTHHMKKKFKRDIEKLEVIKIQFCDLYKNIIAIEARDEECKFNIKELNFNNSSSHKEEVHYIKIPVTQSLKNNNDRIISNNPNDKIKRGLKDSVPRETKRINMSTIEHTNDIRPLTPPRKDIQKYMKIINEKNEQLNTSSINHSHIIPQTKRDKPVDIKDKNIKAEKRENQVKSFKDDANDKQKKEKESKIKELELKKERLSDKISEKKEKKEKKDDHSVNTKHFKYEKEDFRNDRNKKEDNKEEFKEKNNEKEKHDFSRQRGYINEKKEVVKDNSKHEKRMSTSVIPDNRYEKTSENKNDHTKKERRTSSTINNKAEKALKNSAYHKDKDEKHFEPITKRESNEEKLKEKEKLGDNKRQSIKKENESVLNNDKNLLNPLKNLEIDNKNKNEEIINFNDNCSMKNSLPTMNKEADRCSDNLEPNNNDSNSITNDINKKGTYSMENSNQNDSTGKSILKEDTKIIDKNEESINDNNNKVIENVEKSINGEKSEQQPRNNVLNNTHNQESEVKIINNGLLNKQIKLKINRIATLDFSSNFHKALFLTSLKKNYLPFQKRLEILSFIKNVSLAKVEIFKEFLKEYEEKVEVQGKLISNYEKDLLIDNHVNKVFAPSKTASNGLNFITKEEENNLIKKEQPNEVLNIFRCIYIIINENYEGIPSNKIIENLLLNIFHKRKIENLSKEHLKAEYLFFNTFPANLNVFTQSQHESLLKLQQDNPKLLNSSDLLKMSRSVSYMTFILKEVFDYLNMKTSDGTFIYMIRTARKTNPLIKEKIDKLQIVLNNL